MFFWPVCRMVTTWQPSQVSFPQAEEREAEVPPRAGSGFVISPAAVQGRVALPEQFAIIWSLVTFSACTQSLSAGLWICHSTAEVSAVIFWSKEMYSNEQFSSGWTSRVTVALSPLNTSERHPKTSAAPSEWSTGCFGIQQERFRWTGFCSNKETTVTKPLDKHLFLLGTVVSAVLNYLYALKNTLGCSSAA